MLIALLIISHCLWSTRAFPTDLHDHTVHTSLPAAWHHEPDHPVHNLFRRAPGDGITYPAVGTPGMSSFFPSRYPTNPIDFFFQSGRPPSHVQEAHPIQLLSLRLGSQLSTLLSPPERYPASLSRTIPPILQVSTPTVQRYARLLPSAGFLVTFGMLRMVSLQVLLTMGLFR